MHARRTSLDERRDASVPKAESRHGPGHALISGSRTAEAARSGVALLARKLKLEALPSYLRSKDVRGDQEKARHLGGRVEN